MSVIAKTASGPHTNESAGTSNLQAALLPEIRLAEDTKTLLTSTFDAELLAILLGNEKECSLPLDNSLSRIAPTAQLLNLRVLRILRASGI